MDRDCEVITIREKGVQVWMVRWHGDVCTPTWLERGPAEAYLDGLMRGRTPELRQL